MKKIANTIMIILFSNISLAQTVNNEITINKEIVEETIKAQPKNGIDPFKLDFAKNLAISTNRIIEINQKYLKIITTFHVDENGKISNVRIINDKHKVAAEISNTFAKLPDWIPAQNNGVNVSSQYTLPLTLNISLPDHEAGKDSYQRRKALEAEYRAFYYEFNKYMIYPNDFWERYHYKKGPYNMGINQNSNVFEYEIKFVVNEEGKFENIQTIVGDKIDEYLNKAVKKALSKCTPWEPAEANGKKVKNGITLPIKIKIEK